MTTNITNTNFTDFPVIQSKTLDNLFEGPSARGDAYCSIWAAIIAKTLISDKLFKKEVLLNEEQPTSIHQVLDILQTYMDNLINMMGEDACTCDLNETLTLTLNELKDLKTQLDTPYEDLNMIIGLTQIKLLAYLMHVNIIIEDTRTQNIYSINHNYLPSIRITTNTIHYSVRNNKKTNDIEFKTDFWWKHMWTWRPYAIQNTDDIIPYC